MAWDRRKAKTTPAVESGQSSLHFSNALPDLSTNSLSSPTRQGTGDSIGNSDAPLLSDTTRRVDPDRLPYVDYSDVPIKVKKPKRQTTASSFRSTASSVWNATKDFGVSHFNVPRLAAPWEHEVNEKEGIPPISHTVRQFEPGRQRRRLWTNSIFQFVVTLFLCGCLATCLAGFQTIPALLLAQKHAFNALVTALSIALGINLASSFQGYAQMMRWRFLASRYRTLQEFELVLQCESQMKVFRLLWTARTRGRLWVNKTQLLCLGWITVNVLLQVLVALLGLTYSLDTSDWLNTSLGQLSICDLHTIQGYDNTFSGVNFQGQLGAANTYGVESAGYSVYQNTGYDSELYDQSVYSNNDQDNAWDYNWKYYEYRFQDQDPTYSALTIVSDRTIRGTATCKVFEVIEGGWGSKSNGTNITYVDEDGKHINMWMDLTDGGFMTYIGTIPQTSDEYSKNAIGCGPRCAEVMALQSADNYTVFKPQFFKCQSRVGHVTNTQEYVEPGQTASLYDMPDEQARIMAGAIGWSGWYYANDPYEYRMYSSVTEWSPSWQVNTTDVEELVSLFAIGGISAMDFNGPRRNVTGWYPVQSQLVTVDWRWAATILGVLPLLQFLALLCIIRWANKVIIKDTGCLSTARLLRPIVDKLGPAGCLLTTDEICEEMKNVRVTYGYREPADYVEHNGMVRHVDILEEEEGLGSRVKMPGGRYDGLYQKEQIGRGEAWPSDEWFEDRRQAAEDPNDRRRRRRRRLSV